MIFKNWLKTQPDWIGTLVVFLLIIIGVAIVVLYLFLTGTIGMILAGVGSLIYLFASTYITKLKKKP